MGPRVGFQVFRKKIEGIQSRRNTITEDVTIFGDRFHIFLYLKAKSLSDEGLGDKIF